MKKWLIVIWIACLLTGAGAGKTQVLAANPNEGFMSVEEACMTGEQLVTVFHEIVMEGAEDQFFGVWIYPVLIEWRTVLEEIGSFMGIGSSSAKVDSEQANITVLVNGTKKNAVFEIVIFEDIEVYPVIDVYSKFSLTLSLYNSGFGAALLLINSGAIIALFILVLIRTKSPKSGNGERVNEAIDQTIANIIKNEEMVDNCELVAVIATAIAASEGREEPDELIVRSVRARGSRK